MRQCQRKIAPIGNRAVIFNTDRDSFHGHPEPMRCPDGTARCSLALYYFTIEDRPEINDPPNIEVDPVRDLGLS